MDYFGIFKFVYVEDASHFAFCKMVGLLPLNTDGNGKVCSTIIPAIFVSSVNFISNNHKFYSKL